MKKLLLIILVFETVLIAKRVSVIVPCHYKHAQYLDNLIHIYENQTMSPDEMVISISEAGHVQRTIQHLLATDYAFEVKIVTHSGRKGPGENRNEAASRATGDILVCQDADDIPHPQRIEVIHHFFCEYDLDHLLHQFRKQREFKLIEDIGKLVPIYPERHSDWFPGKFYPQGVPAISRALFNRLKWGSTITQEDTRFNQEAYRITKKRLLLPYVLYHYRQHHGLCTRHHRKRSARRHRPILIDGDEPLVEEIVT